MIGSAAIQKRRQRAHQILITQSGGACVRSAGSGSALSIPNRNGSTRRMYGLREQLFHEGVARAP